MSQSGSFTFYTYARVDPSREDRWAYTGISDIFFDDEESARQDLRELRADVESEAGYTWQPMQLEKIETLPVSRETILALLNDGVGSFVRKYEIVEVID
ncbi:hypothetical protein [Ensifer adhaerens]|uniref:hypothetical protein n=1 Tax=Ensifer adhaerens TaxID=106592 RepID=UPI000CF11052|nr:hypothetical protein [Ensifer adhaerens]